MDPAQREAYLAACVPVVEEARRAPGCHDFALSADPVDPSRITVLERWESRGDVEAFRRSGPSEGQRAAILSASVAQYEVSTARSLTG